MQRKKQNKEISRERLKVPLKIKWVADAQFAQRQSYASRQQQRMNMHFQTKAAERVKCHQISTKRPICQVLPTSKGI